MTQQRRKVKFFVKSFPKNTESIYITGSTKQLGNWDPNKAIKMQYYQNEGTDEIFFLELNLPIGESIEYKYLNHRSWDSVECGIVAQEIENRSVTIKDEADRVVIDNIKGFRI